VNIRRGELTNGGFNGALLTYVAAGHVAPLTAGEALAGVCEEKVDNASGSAGDKNAQFINDGEIIFRGQSGFALSDVGLLVYGSDDATLTTTVGSNTLVGKITKFFSESKIQVKLLHPTA